MAWTCLLPSPGVLCREGRAPKKSSHSVRLPSSRRATSTSTVYISVPRAWCAKQRLVASAATPKQRHMAEAAEGAEVAVDAGDAGALRGRKPLNSLSRLEFMVDLVSARRAPPPPPRVLRMQHAPQRPCPGCVAACTATLRLLRRDAAHRARPQRLTRFVPRRGAAAVPARPRGGTPHRAVGCVKAAVIAACSAAHTHADAWWRRPARL